MDRTIIDSFNQLIITHKSMHRKYLEDLGLFFGQPRLLYQIKENPGLSQNDLVEILKVSKEAVSTSVRRLEKKGFIIREVDSSDKRKKVLFLSHEGSKVLEQVWDKQNDTYKKLLEPLNKSEKYELKRMFDVMIDTVRGKVKND